MKETSAQKQTNGTYLIDSNGDDDWDYSFNPSTSTLSIYHLPTPGFELVFNLCTIAIAILLWIKKRSV